MRALRMLPRNASLVLAFCVTFCCAGASVSQCSSKEGEIEGGSTSEEHQGSSTLEKESNWERMTHEQIADVKLAVLPLGSLEQHGPHLPLGTDLLLAKAFADEIASSHLSSEGQVAVLPVSPFGASFEHMTFPGTIAIRDNTLVDLWFSVVKSIATGGVHRIVLMNAHGGQTPNVEMVTRRSRFELEPQVVALSINIQAIIHDCGELAIEETGMSSEEWAVEQSQGIHGGLVETSLMLHLHPSLVNMSAARHFSRRVQSSGRYIEPHSSAVSYGWRAEDLSSAGALGDASRASEEFGKKLFALASKRILSIVEELHSTDTSALLVQ